MSVKIEASMMCADYAALEPEVRILEQAGVNYLHLDIMDGHYVPNLTFGPDYVKCLRRITQIPFSVHLMVEEPERIVDWFGLREGDRVCFHPDTTRHPLRCLKQIQDMGMGAGVAINPSMPLAALEELVNYADFLQFMTINPGFAGQAFIRGTLPKLRRLSGLLADSGRAIDIVVDGSVQFDNLLEIVDHGATSLVLGAFTCFNRDLGVAASLEKVKGLLQQRAG